MNEKFTKGESVLVFDKLEQDWYEGRVVDITNGKISVEYETEYYYHVGPVEYEYLKKRIVSTKKE